MIDLHDAQVEDVVIVHAGAVTLHFAHVGVYERKGDELYNLVSYRAELVISGVTEFLCEGVISADGWVSGLFLDGRELSPVDETALTSKVSASSAELKFFGGLRIFAKCKQVSLHLLARGKVIEVWEGPL